MNHQLLHILIFLFFLPITGQGQDLITQFSHFGAAEGFGGNSVLAFLEDTRGFVWTANHEEVRRFDGYEFSKVLRRKDIRKKDFFGGMLSDEAGNIWLKYTGTVKDSLGNSRNTFYVIDTLLRVHRFEDFFKEQLSFPIEDLCNLTELADGKIYLTTNSGVIYLYDGQFRLWYSQADERLKNCSVARKIPSEDAIIVHQNMNVFKVTPTTITLIYDIEALKKQGNQKVMSRTIGLFMDKNMDELFIADWMIKLLPNDFLIDSVTQQHVFPKGMFSIKRLKNGHSVNYFTAGTNHLALYNEKGYLLHDFSTILKQEFGEIEIDNAILFREGQCWIRRAKGFFILHYQNNAFEQYLQQSQVYNSRGIHPLKNGGFLFAGSLGCLKLTADNQLEKAILPQGTREGLIGVEELTDGRILFGRHGPEVLLYELETGATTRIKPQKEDNKKFADVGCKLPFQDKWGNIWVGTTAGLAKIDLKTQHLQEFQQYNEFLELKKNAVYFFKENGDNLWLATSNGLYILNPEQGITQHFEPLPDLDIVHFYQSGDVFWLATYGDGLVKWNKKTGKTKIYDTSNGFLNNKVVSVFPDTLGNLWIGTETGLVHFTIATEEVYVFLDSDGVTHNEFNRFSHYQAEDGKIYLGGMNGITAFYPEKIKENEQKEHPLEITNYHELDVTTGIYQQKFTEFLKDAKIILDRESQPFKIHFSLLNYEKTDYIRYAWKIEGLNEEWMQQKENVLTINQLPHGNYVLKIKAKNYSGQWNAEEIAIPIIVTIPFYQQVGWQIVGGLLLLGLLYGLFRYQLNAEKRRTEALEKAVAERTHFIENQKQELAQSNQTKDRLFTILAHDLRNPVLAFQNLAESVNYLLKKNQPERVLAMGQFIEKEAARLHHLLDNLLNWSMAQREELPVIITSLSLRDIVASVVSNNQHLSEMSGVLLKNEVGEGMKIFGDRRVLETVLRNLVSNAFRYTQSGDWIKISAQEMDESIHLKVSDNGVGIASEKLVNLFEIDDSKNAAENGTISIGLHLCQELIRLIDGKIKVESEEGKGTVFTIILRIGN
jgi:signal transduction histidine kinase